MSTSEALIQPLPSGRPGPWDRTLRRRVHPMLQAPGMTRAPGRSFENIWMLGQDLEEARLSRRARTLTRART